MRSARVIRSLLIPLLFSAAIAPSLHAQSVDTAGLEVDVRDSSGALVPGAALTLIQTSTHAARTGVTDGNGRFRFVELPVGGYQLLAHKDGLSETTQNGLTLSVSQSAVLHLVMPPASAQASITVTSDVSAVDPDRTTIGQTVSTVEVDNLPSNGRNFLDFAVTAPGVTVTQTTGQNSGFSVNGQRSRSNSIQIDGVENNGALNGNVRQTLSQDAIAQFQVLTEQFPAEYGGAAGGFINVVTRSGSDHYRGTAYYFVRNDFLNSPNAFATATPGNYSRNDVGGSFGGPIRENKTYFFGALEYIGLNTSAAQSSSFLNNAATVNAALARGILIGSPVTSLTTSGYIPQSSAQTLSSLRLDHRFNDRNTMVGRILYGQYLQANSTNAGTIYDLSTATGTYTHTQNYFAEFTHIFSPTVLDETHVMIAPQRLKQLPNTYGPGANVAGNVYIGPTADFPVTLDEDHYEADNALSWTRGSHLFKFGAQVNYIRAHSVFPTNFAGYWNFYSASNFSSSIPYRYTQSFGNPDVRLPDALLGFYAEDSWKATSRLTVNFGVRYDLDLQPGGLNQNASDPIQANLSKGMPRDYNNFAPRVGLALALDSKGKTVLRAGYGMFYDKNILVLARNTLQSKETLVLNQTSAVTPTTLFKTGPLPQGSTYPTGYGAPSISRAYPNMLLPFAHQIDFGIDRAITQRIVFSATYVHVSGEKLLKASNSNLNPPVILTPANQTSYGFAAYNATVTTCTAVNSSLAKTQPCFQQYNRPFYAGRKDPAFNDINLVGPWGHSNYNGLRAVLQAQSTHGLTFRFGYVWAKAIDDAPDFLNGALPDNPFNPHAEKSVSNEDVRNRFTGTVVYRIPFPSRRGHLRIARQFLGNWIVSGIMTAGSGTPENITVGSDINNDNSSTDRPFINGVIASRNSFRGARQSTVALRGLKEIRLRRGSRLTLSAEAFNLTAHYNITDYSTVWGLCQVAGNACQSTTGTPTNYGAPDAAGSSRTLQLGIRYTF